MAALQISEHFANGSGSVGMDRIFNTAFAVHSEA